MVQWTYLQDRNRDADVENELLDTAGEEEAGKNWESSLETYITIWKLDSQWEVVV